MTTVVWSRTHNEVAADRLLIPPKMDSGKLFHVPGGILTGAGYYDAVVEVVNWFQNGCRRDQIPQLPEVDSGKDSEFMFVDSATGDAYFLTYPYLRLVKVNEPFLCIGSGSNFALGALAAGATPAEALRIAHKYDPFTGPSFDIIQVGNNGTSGRKKTVRAKSS